MKVAFVYDRINKFGGAERLLLVLHRLYPGAPIFTLVHEPNASTWAKGIKIISTFLNKIDFLRKRHEWLAPIAPLAFETLNFSEFDLVISLTSSDAKSVITKPHQLHVCYCLTPTRYFWSGEKEYSKDKKYRLLPKFLIRYLKLVDELTAMRPDFYFSISQEIKKRVKKYYKRESVVIYPPIEEKFYSKKIVPLHERENYLIVSRLVPYKKVDLAIQAFNKLNLPLTVIGTGSEMKRLKKMSKSNISFVGQVNDERLIEYYRHAKIVIFPQEEDFGLVPLEAQASGTPVIAYAKGGALETILPKRTGLFFAEQTVESLVNAVLESQKTNFDLGLCFKNASRFNYQNFALKFSSEISKIWAKHSQAI